MGMRSSVALDDADELEVPPMVACSRCGRADCPGCSPRGYEPRDGVLPWETTDGSWFERIYRTAEMSALEPERVFGKMNGDELMRALAFGLSCEALALSSLGVAYTTVSYLLFPAFTREFLSSMFAWKIMGVLAVGALSVMMGVHVLWGFCMEMGARLMGARMDQRRGFTFGMYSTGWDLLTSPVGAALSLRFRGKGFLAPVMAATRVPRRAVDAYLDECRGFDARERKGAVRFTTLTFLGCLLGLLILAVVAALIWIRHELG